MNKKSMDNSRNFNSIYCGGNFVFLNLRKIKKQEASSVDIKITHKLGEATLKKES